MAIDELRHGHRRYVPIGGDYLKDLEMSTNNPNRNRNQSADRTRVGFKQSGDQHLFPEDDSQQGVRPHRLSREDMQKFSASSSTPDNEESQ